MNSNQRKHAALGEPYATARNKLNRMLLFEMAGKLGLLSCFQCGRQIETLVEFSVEHKIPWQGTVTPQETFYDLSNIAFSHHLCNARAGLGNRPRATHCRLGHRFEVMGSGRKSSKCTACERRRYSARRLRM